MYLRHRLVIAELKLSGETGHMNNGLKRNNKQRAPRLPCFVTIKVIAESRQKRYREPTNCKVTFFCMEANGKIIEESFGAMVVNNAPSAPSSCTSTTCRP